MELGEKLRQARLEAGLSQRQLCGGEITRNMLSQIEHGTARPSMDTLRFLAGQLGKPVSYFLEEDALASPNQLRMTRAREAWDREDWETLARSLADFQLPDPVYSREYEILKVMAGLELARKAIAQGREPYARELLEKAGTALETVTYCREDLERRRLLLLGQLRGIKRRPLVQALPTLDPELLLRARGALEEENLTLSACLLDAAGDQKAPEWGLLRGRVYLQQQEYAQAARCFHLAEEAFPRETARPLEHCYRELGDFRMAYNYACRERSFLGQM